MRAATNIRDDAPHEAENVDSALISQRTRSTRSAISISTRRITQGTPLESVRVIPSGAPLPLDAQRDFRGWIVIGIVILILIGILLNVILISRVSKRTVYYAPSAERIGESTNFREATDFEALSMAQMLVARLETHTPQSAEHVWENILPYLHPSLHEKVKDDYEEIARLDAALWQHRVAIPLGAAIGGRHVGIITVAVFYDSCELTGRDERSRQLSKIVEKAAYVQFAMDAPSKDNPFGLVMTRYVSYDRDSWISNGFPDMWGQFRK